MENILSSLAEKLSLFHDNVKRNSIIDFKQINSEPKCDLKVTSIRKSKLT